MSQTHTLELPEALYKCADAGYAQRVWYTGCILNEGLPCRLLED